MRCARCGAEIPEEAKFCEECASPFTRRCPSCDTENSLTTKFSIGCAKPFDSKGQVTSGSGNDLGQQMRTLTETRRKDHVEEEENNPFEESGPAGSDSYPDAACLEFDHVGRSANRRSLASDLDRPFQRPGDQS